MIEQLLRRSPVIPVVTLDDASGAADLARAYARGGLSTIEVTLRTPAGLRAIEAIARDVPQITVCAGSVRDEAELAAAFAAGAVLAVSPGSTAPLLAAGRGKSMPLLPGIATASELQLGYSLGYRVFKFFPARFAGGPDAIRALSAPFPEAHFCPTGGITPESAASYLELSAVLAVGVSWLAPADVLRAHDWHRIEVLAREALQRLAPVLSTRER